MALRREQLEVVGHLYRDSVLLSHFADAYLTEVEQSSPRDVLQIQALLVKFDALLSTWFMPVRQRAFFNSGLEGSLKLDVMAILATLLKFFRPVTTALPNISREPLTIAEKTAPSSLEEFMYAMDGMNSVLATCLLAIVADNAYHYQVNDRNEDNNVIFSGLGKLETRCLVLKAVEQAAEAKDWPALEELLENNSFPQNFIDAVKEKDETSYWFKPWLFKQWMELFDWYTEKKAVFSDEVKQAFINLLSEQERGKEERRQAGQTRSVKKRSGKKDFSSPI